jgi:nitrite reductase/ring-hydroxylating ferredoxin subunit
MASGGRFVVHSHAMRRNDKLVEFSRRDFCALAGTMGLVITGCTDGGAPVVETGALGDHPDAPQAGTPDAHQVVTPDAKPGSPDAATTGPACSGAATDVGAASSYAMNTPKLYSSAGFFVVRDSGGLYAVSSICTHEGATNGLSSGHFRCPRHGATFTHNGDILGGPVFTGLVHYAMCMLPNGNVGVQTGQEVAQSTRLVA